MDRLDAMKVFVVAVDEEKSRSRGPQTWPLARRGQPRDCLPRGAGWQETRSIKLSEEGERYVASCRRVLATYRHRRLQSDCATASNLSDRAKNRERLLPLEPDCGQAAITPTTDIFPDLEHPAISVPVGPFRLPRRQHVRLSAECRLPRSPTLPACPCCRRSQDL